MGNMFITPKNKNPVINGKKLTQKSKTPKIYKSENFT